MKPMSPFNRTEAEAGPFDLKPCPREALPPGSAPPDPGRPPPYDGQKAQEVRRHFDQVASRYDLMNTLLSFGVHHLWKRRAVGLLDLKPGERVLDVCGGTGDLARLAAARVREKGRVVLLDFNRAMLGAGRPKLHRAGLEGRIFLLQGDALALPFASAGFDAITIAFGLRNLARLETGLKEMHRVLKPGGRLMCLEFSQPHPPWFSRLYDLYSFYVMPLAGQLITGSRAAYTYLTQSIRQFPAPEDLAATLRSLGFRQVYYQSLTQGIAVIHLGMKE